MGKVTQQSLRAKGNPVLVEILDNYTGKQIEDLEHAIWFRKRILFAPGAKVRLVGTRNVEIDGQVGTVIKHGPKRIGVGLGEKTQWGTYEREFNVPPAMLEPVS